MFLQIARWFLVDRSFSYFGRMFFWIGRFLHLTKVFLIGSLFCYFRPMFFFSDWQICFAAFDWVFEMRWQIVSQQAPIFSFDGLADYRPRVSNVLIRVGRLFSHMPFFSKFAGAAHGQELFGEDMPDRTSEDMPERMPENRPESARRLPETNCEKIREKQRQKI